MRQSKTILRTHARHPLEMLHSLVGGHHSRQPPITRGPLNLFVVT